MLGRAAEQAALETLLGASGPAVAAVAGEAGTGKSTLVRWALERAGELGRETMPPSPDTELCIAPSTDLDELWGWLPPAYDPWQTSGVATEPTDPGAGEHEHWALAFERHAPFFVAIDGYRPAAEFDEWFGGGLIPAIRRRGADVVFLIAVERADDLASSALDPDVVLELGVIDPSEIRQFVSKAGEERGLGLKPAEVDVYANRLSERPILVGPLMRVLAWDSGGPPPNEEATR